MIIRAIRGSRKAQFPLKLVSLFLPFRFIILAMLDHLRKDPKLKKVIDKVGPIKLSGRKDLYFSLMRAIVGQQLSVKAAETIFNRFLSLFPDNYPEAKKVLKLADEKLRSVGLSAQKASYIRNIAKFSIEKSLDHTVLKKMSDDELIDYLSSIKGVGRWTAEMLLMFSLKREDVFPKDDLGIQTAMIKLYKLSPQNKKDLFLQMEKISEKWRPCRTLACMYLWRFKDGI